MSKPKTVINWGKIFREQRLEQTGNDARFTTRVVRNRKAEASKTACRKWKDSI